MTYGTATITGSATPAADLRTAIEALMTAQGNWELADTYTGGTYSVRMWRCNAGNVIGVQWYLAMMVSSSAPAVLEFRPFEDYVTATKLGIRGIAQVSALDVPSSSPYGSTGYVPEHNNWNPSGHTLLTSVSAFTYRVRVTANGVMATSSAATYPLYTGLFNKIWSHANEFPLCRWPVGTNSIAAGFTRRPGATVAFSGNWSSPSNFSMTTAGFDNTFGSLGTPDSLCGAELYASRIALIHNSTTTGSNEVCRGYMDTDFMAFFKNDLAVAVGDTISIAGNPYICVYDNGVTGSAWMRTD